MAFFKFRKRGDDASAPSTQASPAESVEAMRKRARQRLIGAAILVLAGVIGFPLVFDSQPRPIAVDIPIEIPDRAKAAKPASTPVAAAAGQVVAGGEAVKVAPEAVATASGPPAVFQPVAAPAAPAVAPVVSAPAAETARAASAPAAPAAPPSAKAAESPALAAASASEGRFVVQVGAFADPAKATAARRKLEAAGLKTYTHVAETKEGKRTRVRVGPFSSRAEADKAAAKVKDLDLPAAVLTL